MTQDEFRKAIADAVASRGVEAVARSTSAARSTVTRWIDGTARPCNFALFARMAAGNAR